MTRVGGCDWLAGGKLLLSVFFPPLESSHLGHSLTKFPLQSECKSLLVSRSSPRRGCLYRAEGSGMLWWCGHSAIQVSFYFGHVLFLPFPFHFLSHLASQLLTPHLQMSRHTKATVFTFDDQFSTCLECRRPSVHSSPGTDKLS